MKISFQLQLPCTYTVHGSYTATTSYKHMRSTTELLIGATVPVPGLSRQYPVTDQRLEIRLAATEKHIYSQHSNGPTGLIVHCTMHPLHTARYGGDANTYSKIYEKSRIFYSTFCIEFGAQYLFPRPFSISRFTTLTTDKKLKGS